VNEVAATDCKVTGRLVCPNCGNTEEFNALVRFVACATPEGIAQPYPGDVEQAKVDWYDCAKCGTRAVDSITRHELLYMEGQTVDFRFVKIEEAAK
jgi:predicted RNA-binding Zn-ribbon protein involved in translation (DUF1610 family)